ncbi:MAG: energy transducer TonB, partial [Gammaproteobacteria bacterium]|nr:energy transducer TonB [Gammaproteobacteria bacterium]
MDAQMSRLNFATAENLANDRLVSTLFLATLFHGLLILGISFNTGLFPDSELAPTLEVVLVNSLSPAATADDSSYLAMENSLGAGNTTDKVTPASRASNPAAADLTGETDATDTVDQREAQQDPTLQLLVTKSLSAFSLVTLQEKQSDPEDRRMAQSSAERNAPLSELYDETRVRDEEQRERVVSVSTQESDIAGYLAGWKRKIEQVGTLNFPALETIAERARNPVLEVAVNADGHLNDIIVRRSSRVRAVDEAAVEILRLASPFDPFPAHMQEKYDVLRFVYEWQFIE